MKTDFHNKLRTKPRFEMEAEVNSEMAYSFSIVVRQVARSKRIQAIHYRR